MFTITSESDEQFSEKEIAAEGLRPVFRVFSAQDREDVLTVEVLTPRRRSHRVSQVAAYLDLPAELVFDTEQRNYVMFRFQVPAVSAKALALALKGANFSEV
jgi:hypothetical protein